MLPGLGGLDIAFPERPGAALARPHVIDGTSRFAVVEDAIAVGLFAQSTAAAGHARVQADDLFDRLAAEFGDGLDLAVVDPDIAGRAGAALAAARAGK